MNKNKTIKYNFENLQKFLLGKNVLVTGHTGFKGSWLTLWLLMCGAKVYGYSLVPKNDQPLFNEFFYKENASGNFLGKLYHKVGDINDYRSLSNFVNEVKPELVFHLAAQPLVQKSYELPIHTWNTNVMGSINVLESLKSLKNPCAAVFITTDKVYANKEWEYGYRENDQLGGNDPYSSSKAAMELAIKSWRSSFCGNDYYQTSKLSIATARAGNVIGGGDWSENRIIPDIVRALKKKELIQIRNPNSKRPWQHLLEPLAGYLILSEKLFNHQINNNNNTNNPYATSFNFGPKINSNKTVEELVEEVLTLWPGEWTYNSDVKLPYESSLLHLISDKAYQMLGWESKLNFEETIKLTIEWYRNTIDGLTPLEAAYQNIINYQSMF